MGDVRHFPLLESFHASVELFRATDSMRVDEFKQRVKRRSVQDQELLVDPHFFGALRRRFPQLCDVAGFAQTGRKPE